MQEKNCISPVQLSLLIIGSRLMFSYTNMPILSFPPGNQDVWISAILGTLFTFVFCLPILYITNKFKGLSMTQYNERVLGNLAGKAVSVAFALYFLIEALMVMIISIVFINSSVFPDTPPWGILVFLIVPVAYLAYQGAGSVARVSSIVVTYVIITVVVFFLMDLPKLDLSVLRPVAADSAAADILIGGLYMSWSFSEVLIIPILAHNCVRNLKIRKTFTVSVIAILLLMLIMIIPTISTLGVEIAKHSWNPYYFFTRQIDTFKVIQRVESFNILAWFMATQLKLALYIYMSSQMLSSVFKVKTHRGFALLLTAILSAVMLLPSMTDSETAEAVRSSPVYIYMTLTFIFIIPVISLAIYVLRRKKIGENLVKVDGDVGIHPCDVGETNEHVSDLFH